MVFFRVDGKCQPKQRPKGTLINGRIVMYTPKETREYESEVAKACGKAVSETPAYKDEPVIAYITIHCKIPSNFSKKKVQMALDEEIVPDKKPDIDNCCKSILDGMLGIAYKDDNQVQLLNARKVYSLEEYVEVTILSREEYRAMKGEEDDIRKHLVNLP